MSTAAAPLSAPTAASRPGLLGLRLSIMMFLQYAVWGAWLPLAGRFLKAPVAQGGLGFDDHQVGNLLGLAGSIGAVAAPFIAGQFADRYFRSERFLAVLLLLGGIVKFVTAAQTTYAGWLWMSVIYSVVFMPTLALSNSLAFAHIRDASRDFPVIRVWGTIGWIAASWAFPMIWLQHGLQTQALPPFLRGDEVPDVTHRLIDSMRFAGIISFVYAAYCLTLPATPPRRNAVERLAFAKAFRLLGQPAVAVLFLTSLIIAAVHQIYFIQTGPFFSHLGLRDSDIGPAMTIGQFSEIIVMALLGVMLTRLGFKRILAIGVAVYALRYAIWGTSSLPASAMVVSQFLHGFGYACFFAASFILIDKVADADVRHSAQTLYGITILGLGPVLGGKLSGYLGERFTHDGVLDWSSFWYSVSGISAAALLLLLLCFREGPKLPTASAVEGPQAPVT